MVRTAEELERCVAGGPLGAILHLEGAEPIEPDLSNLEGWYARGLRSIGLVWSRPNAFAYGAPFRYPGSADAGPGLTRVGRALVDACGRLGIALDVSHLNARGLRGVLRRARGPVVATHSNAHAVCPASRNLTDTELRAIAATGGVVGITFSVAMLRPDGGIDTRTPLADVVRHVGHVAEKAGIDHVALGSDFDGAAIPDEIGDVTGLPRVLEALRAAGYGDDDLRKIAHGNWLRVLGEVWRD
jgi:membrane dipeptidase